MNKTVENFISTEALSTQDEKHEISGVAMQFNKTTLNGTRYNENVTFRERLPLLYQHDEDKVIGNVEFTKDKSQVTFKANVNPNVELGKQVWENLKHGDLTGVSIGAIVEDGGIEYNREEDVLDITNYMLYELSVVTVPANQDARISLIESLQKEPTKEDEVITEDNPENQEETMKDKNYNELVELKNELNSKIETKTSEMLDTQKLVENLTEPTEAEKHVEKVNSLREEIEACNVDLTEVETLIENKAKQMEELKSNMYLAQQENTKSENKKGASMNSTEKFRASEKSKDLFVEALRTAMKNKSSLGKEYTEAVKMSEGFTGDLDALVPTSVLGDITDLMDKEGRLLNLVQRTQGVVGDVKFLINIGEELGHGWGGNSEAKVEQNNELISITISQQYIYKYVTVSRELLDQPNDVLYNYVIKELAQRLVLTAEKAILVGGVDGVDETKIVPMTKYDTVNDILGTTVADVVVDGDTLDLLDADLKGDGQTIFAMNKKTYTELKLARDNNGVKLYEAGETTINGVSYKTLNGFVVYETDWLIPANDETIAGGEDIIVGFKYNAYRTIEKSSVADFFSQFTLENNTYKFLTEVSMGGTVDTAKSVVVGQAPAPAGA